MEMNCKRAEACERHHCAALKTCEQAVIWTDITKDSRLVENETAVLESLPLDSGIYEFLSLLYPGGEIA